MSMPKESVVWVVVVTPERVLLGEPLARLNVNKPPDLDAMKSKSKYEFTGAWNEGRKGELNRRLTADGGIDVYLGRSFCTKSGDVCNNV